MLTFADLDPSVTLQEQLADNRDEPIVLMILFTVDLADAEAFQRAWAKDAAFCKAQPGFIAAQLHQGLCGSSLWLDCAVFENVAALAATNQQPEFATLREAYPDSASAQLHLFQRVAIPNICTGEARSSGQPRTVSQNDQVAQAAEITRLRARLAELERRE